MWGMAGIAWQVSYRVQGIGVEGLEPTIPTRKTLQIQEELHWTVQVSSKPWDSKYIDSTGWGPVHIDIGPALGYLDYQGKQISKH